MSPADTTDASASEPDGAERRSDPEHFTLEETGSEPPLWERHLVAIIVAAVALAFVVLSVTGVIRIDIFTVVVSGLQFGAIYALFALGLALVYKSTRVLNFAQGELGTVPAWVVFLIINDFTLTDGVSEATIGRMLVATLAAVVVGAVLAVLINLFVIQRLADVKPVTTLVATVGVALAFSASQLIAFEARARNFPRFFGGAPSGLDLGVVCLSTRGEGGECLGTAGQFSIAGARITWHVVIIVIVLAVTAMLLAAFFRTPPGVALLATSQEPFAAELHGVSVRTMSTIAWAFAGAFAALGGVLGAGVFQSLRPGLITTTFLIPAIVAAVLGGITSMVGAVAGGLILGVAVALANNIVVSYNLSSLLPGPPQIATMAVLLGVLLLRPRGLFGKEA